MTCTFRGRMSDFSPPLTNGTARLADLPVPIEVRLGNRDVTLDEIQAFRAGVALPLNTRPGDPLELFVGNVRLGMVDVVVKDGRLCARVVEIQRTGSTDSKGTQGTEAPYGR